MRIYAAAVMACVGLVACATGSQSGDIVETVAPETVSASGQATKYPAYSPPEPGTLLTYASSFVGEDDSVLRQLVVASGKDYAIFATLLDEGLTGEGDFFVEYAGVYWQECTVPSLTQYQRDKLFDLWPLEVGDQVQIPFQGDLSAQMDVEVLEWTTVDTADLGEQDAVRIMNRYSKADYSTVLPKLGYSARIDWGEEGAADYLGFDSLQKVERVNLDDYSDYVEAAQSACFE